MKDKIDLVTGLKTRTNAGRPNWDKVFQKLLDEGKGEIPVGHPMINIIFFKLSIWALIVKIALPSAMQLGVLHYCVR